TGTFRGKPRRNGRASERQYLRSAICATRSKAPRGPRSDTDHRTIYLIGIDANGKVARASARSRFRELTARWRPYGSAQFIPGVGHGYQLLRLTLERKHPRQLASNASKISWKTAGAAGRHQIL